MVKRFEAGSLETRIEVHLRGSEPVGKNPEIARMIQPTANLGDGLDLERAAAKLMVQDPNKGLRRLLEISAARGEDIQIIKARVAQQVFEILGVSTRVDSEAIQAVISSWRSAPASQVEFVVEDLVGVDPETLASVKSAVAMVWQKFSDEPSTFRLVFATHFTNSTAAALYDPDLDTMTFAMETIANRCQLCTGDEPANMFIIAAHETTHRVQCTRGDRPRPSLGNENYANDRHEHEAWTVALDAFKKRYPRASGRILAEGNEFTIPPSSTF